MTAHAATVHVRWGDVDLAGIAFYPRFYEWYDLGSEALFASLGLAWPETFPKYDIVGVPPLMGIAAVCAYPGTCNLNDPDEPVTVTF